MTTLTRRTLLAGAAFAAAAPALRLTPAFAAAPPATAQAPGIYRYKVGSYELTAVNDGVWNRALDDKFVKNAAFADVQQAAAAAYLPADTLPIPFTTLIINTGSKLIAIDTGTGGQLAPTAGTLGANLAAAGIDPKAVDTVLISHFHPDHINGLKTKDNVQVFANAEILVPQVEWAYWMDDAKMGTAPEGLQGNFRNVRRVFGDIQGKVAKFEWGKEVAPGITAVAAPGHTPGHTAFTIASGNAAMLVLSDTTNHPALFVRHPEWHAVFDMDGALAADNRKKLLDRAVADKMLVQGYHFPFPASGYIARDGAGFALVPVQWQPAL